MRWIIASVFASALVWVAAEERPPVDCCPQRPNVEVAAVQAVEVAQVVDAVKDAAKEAEAAPKYALGRKQAKNKGFLIALSAQRHASMLDSLPKATEAKFDLCDLGIVPPVKNQASCGSCWDFSGVAVAESACIQAGQGKADGSWGLSEQFVLDCGQNGGCNGDDNTTVLAMAKAKGLPTVADYGAYQGRESRCAFNSKMKLNKISDWGFCQPENDQAIAGVQRIKDCMKKFGVIGCAIAADNAFMNVQPGQVFRGNSNGINHDVALVGWDDAKGAWKLRNSWGKNWCDNGYCWIAYGANQVGFEAVWATCGASPTPPAPPTPTPPTPVPPAPPSPTPGTVTLTLTAEQVKAVISQSGAVKIHPDMTIRELLQTVAPQPAPQPAPPAPAAVGSCVFIGADKCKCPDCDGRGLIPTNDPTHYNWARCSKCNGQGWIAVPRVQQDAVQSLLSGPVSPFPLSETVTYPSGAVCGPNGCSVPNQQQQWVQPQSRGIFGRLLGRR